MELINQQKVALGLSGGVDSAVAAMKLKAAGYKVVGVFIECYREDGCRSDQDRKDALGVAMKLDIPFMSLDFRHAYQERVLTYFYTEYQAGRTPNPDVLCNREIKFGLFLDWAQKEGFELVATGHYARTVSKEDLNNDDFFVDIDQKKFLAMAADEWKDQTYFLNQVAVENLPKIIFPLGEMKKSEVRELAQMEGLSVAQKKDSTGVCFVGEVNVHEFLKEKLGEKPGLIMNTLGEVVGEHDGAWFYTPGQRHGLRIQVKTANASPVFVLSKNMEENLIVVGGEEEMWQSFFKVSTVNWLVNEKKSSLMTKISGKVESGKIWVRIRHTGEMVRVRAWSKEGVVELEKPLKGISEGQFAVFYLEVKQKSSKDWKICVGGGEIL